MIYSPNGEVLIPDTPAEVPRQVTMADLHEFLSRLGIASSRMSEHSTNRALFDEAAIWLVKLAKQCVVLTEQLEQARVPEPPQDWGEQ